MNGLTRQQEFFVFLVIQALYLFSSGVSLPNPGESWEFFSFGFFAWVVTTCLMLYHGGRSAMCDNGIHVTFYAVMFMVPFTSLIISSKGSILYGAGGGWALWMIAFIAGYFILGNALKNFVFMPYVAQMFSQRLAELIKEAEILNAPKEKELREKAERHKDSEYRSTATILWGYEEGQINDRLFSKVVEGISNRKINCSATMEDCILWNLAYSLIEDFRLTIKGFDFFFSPHEPLASQVTRRLNDSKNLVAWEGLLSLFWPFVISYIVMNQLISRFAIISVAGRSLKIHAKRVGSLFFSKSKFSEIVETKSNSIDEK